VSTFLHACEGEAVTKLTNEKVPYFNAPIYLQNKTQIGKVEEIFGPINESVSIYLRRHPRPASLISLNIIKTK
jgi:H/ACA ribonucleoprotein complex subunit 1